MACFTKYLLIGAGGFVGAVARFLIGTYVANKMGTKFPYGTFVINCSGSFLVGLVMALLTQNLHWSANWRYFIPIGFIAAYTTFSTFEFETLSLIQDGQLSMALWNVGLSITVGFAAVWLGVVAGKAIS